MVVGSEDGDVEFAFYLGHAVEGVGEVFSDFVPVAHAAFDTADAVVVSVAKFVHCGQFDACSLYHCEAVVFGESVFDEWGA